MSGFLNSSFHSDFFETISVCVGKRLKKLAFAEGNKYTIEKHISSNRTSTLQCDIENPCKVSMNNS